MCIMNLNKKITARLRGCTNRFNGGQKSLEMYLLISQINDLYNDILMTNNCFIYLQYFTFFFSFSLSYFTFYFS